MKRITKTLFTICTALLVWTVQAQSLNQAVQSVDRDLEAALKELAQMREEIASQRIPLAQEVEVIETEVLTKSARLTREQNLRDNREIGLAQLQNEVNSKREEIEYVGGLLRDFVRSFGATLHVSERQHYNAMLNEADAAALAGNLSDEELFDIQMKVVEGAVKRINQIVGGYVFDGRAMFRGERIPGRFAHIGPTVFFRADDGDAAGIAMAETASAEVADATIQVSQTFNQRAIAATIDNRSGTLPFDATLGAAFVIEQSQDTFWEHVAKGGVVGYLIMSLGLVTALIGLFKVYAITTFRVPSGAFALDLAEMVKKGHKDQAISKAQSFGGLSGEMFKEAVENSDQPRSLIEEYLSVKIIIARRKLESFLPFIAIIAAAAPLMGLLGTVVGMIKTFKLITVFGTGDARALSSGISEALVTTQLGLSVAIPALIVHGILNRMARTKWGQLEQDSIIYLNDLKDD